MGRFTVCALSSMFCIAFGDSIIKREGPTNWFNLTTLECLSDAKTTIFNIICCVFFFYIGELFYHHCVSWSLFIFIELR